MPKIDMLINDVPGEECRIALVQDGKLEELYQERTSAESHVGNIYKGRVANIEPSIQAAFIEFGLERNGFLHISDLHPKYFPGKDREAFEKVGSKTPRRERPPIQKCLRRGQDILVQVLKEGIGTKGPTLTSYLSIPGRFLVMMPHMKRLGVSRKIDDDDARRKMRDLLSDLKPPDGFGFIVRTAGTNQTKTELKRDLAYLTRLWKAIDRRTKKTSRIGELYTESDLVIRTIRDVFTSDIGRVIVDDPTSARRAKDFLAVANPRAKSPVVYYDDPVPLFHRFGVESQIDLIHAREVPLPSGGALVIDQTEALVAIDVNSGKSRDARDSETNAYQTNLEATDEICRQLRLRDLGGLIVNDLIDMNSSKHRRAVEQRFRKNLRTDRARTRVGPISQFGILEMTRQRMRPSLESAMHRDCQHCHGLGIIKSAESIVLEVMRRLALVMHRKNVARVELTISPDVAFHLLNRKRTQLVELERRHETTVMVRVGGSSSDYVQIKAIDSQGGVIGVDMDAEPAQLKPPGSEHLHEINDDSEGVFEPVRTDGNAGDDDDGPVTASPGQSMVDEIEDVDDLEPAVEDISTLSDEDDDDQPQSSGKRKRQRKRSRSGNSKGRGGDDKQNADDQKSPDGDDDKDGQPRRRRRRRRRSRRSRSSNSDEQSNANADDSSQGKSGGDDQSNKSDGGKQSGNSNDQKQSDNADRSNGDDDESSKSGKGKSRSRRRRRRRSSRNDSQGGGPNDNDNSDKSQGGQGKSSRSSGKSSSNGDGNSGSNDTVSSGYSNRVVGKVANSQKRDNKGDSSGEQSPAGAGADAS